MPHLKNEKFLESNFKPMKKEIRQTLRNLYCCGSFSNQQYLPSAATAFSCLTTLTMEAHRMSTVAPLKTLAGISVWTTHLYQKKEAAFLPRIRASSSSCTGSVPLLTDPLYSRENHTKPHHAHTQNENPDEKLHVLPLSLLRQVTQFIQQKMHEGSVKQELKDELISRTCELEESGTGDDWLVNITVDEVEERKDHYGSEADDVPDLSALFQDNVCNSKKIAKNEKSKRKKGYAECSGDNPGTSHYKDTCRESKDHTIKSVKRKRKCKSTNSSQGHGEVTDKKKKRPNYFVAVQISDEQIHKSLKEVQDSVIENEAMLRKVMVSLPMLHVTLMVMSLTTDEDMENAKEALNLCLEKLESLYSHKQLLLTFEGLDHFKNEVVFAKIKGGEELKALHDISEIVAKCFAERKIESADSKGFSPHLTVMKLSKDKSHTLKRKGIKKVDKKLYEAYAEKQFGVQYVEGLQLCAMNAKKTEDGYYKIVHKVQFGSLNISQDKNIEEGTDEEFCKEKEDLKTLKEEGDMK